MEDLLKIANAAYEKTAMARAWKANIGALGEKSRALLESKGILNYGKEMAGLNTGSANIIKNKGGIVTHHDAGSFREAMSTAYDQEPGLQAIGKAGILDKNTYVSSTGQAFDLSKGSVGVTYGKQPFVNKGNGMPHIFNTGNAEEDAYGAAILHRHEANELRYGITAARTPNKSVDIQGTHMPATMFGQTGHLSPKVITRESADVAIAPPAVKDKFVKARTTIQEGLGTLEGPGLDMMAKLKYKRNFNYGESGVHDKNVGVLAEKAYMRVNKPQLNTIKQMTDEAN